MTQLSSCPRAREYTYTATREILRSREGTSRRRVKNSLCIFTICRGRESTRGSVADSGAEVTVAFDTVGRDERSCRRRDHPRPVRLFIARGPAHSRHSSLPTIQILIQLRERRGCTFFLRPRQPVHSFFPPEAFRGPRPSSAAHFHSEI